VLFFEVKAHPAIIGRLIYLGPGRDQPSRNITDGTLAYCSAPGAKGRERPRQVDAIVYGELRVWPSTT